MFQKSTNYFHRDFKLLSLLKIKAISPILCEQAYCCLQALMSNINNIFHCINITVKLIIYQFNVNELSIS